MNIGHKKLLLIGGLLSSIPITSAIAKKQPNPNFIIILCDDLGYGDIACYGNPTISTPHIDKMASEGLKMTQFYTGAAISTPSRSSFLTGRLPVRNGMYGDKTGVLFPNSKSGLGQDEITIAKALKQKQYNTACIGKWHLGAFSPYLPTDHGFDYYFGIPYSNDMSPTQVYSEYAEKNYPPTPLLINNQKIEDEPNQGELTRRYTEQAIEYIKKNAGQAFFLYFAHTFPHVPLYTNDRFKGTSRRGLYGDVVEEIDWSVGEIFRTLKELQLDKNTFVIFTSDNGPWLTKKEHGGSAGPFKDGKGTWYEGGFRVPAIYWMPEVIKATNQEAICSAMDIFPTMLEMAGISLSKNTILDGRSMVPFLTGKEEKIRDEIFYWWGSKLMAVRKGSWKYYFNVIENQYTANTKISIPETPLLYNVETDPSEQYNQAVGNEEIIFELTQLAKKHKEEMKIKDSVCDLR